MKKIISIIVVVILGAIFIPKVINYFFPKSNDTADYDGGNHTDHVNVTVKNFEGPESTKSRTLTASDGDLYFGNEVIYCEGYDFLGLYDSAEGGTMYVDENQSQVTDIFSSITLYARWSPKTYYIYFDDTESQLSHKEGELSVLYGSSVTSFPVLEKEGHDFLGWASNDGIRYSEGSAVLREKQKIHVNNYQFDESNTIRLSPIFEPE